MYKVVIDNSETIIPLSDFKEFARVTSCVSSDEALMEALLLASIDYCEKYTGLSIATKTYEKIYQYGFRDKVGYDKLELQKGYVTEVLGISENFVGADPNIIDITDIEIDNYKQRTDIYVPNASFSYGTHPTRPLVVRFVAGWDENTLPNNMKTAVMQLASYWYENRETAQLLDNTNIAEMPFGTSAILNIYRLVRM